MSNNELAIGEVDRRGFVGAAGSLVLSATAIALISGIRTARAQGASSADTIEQDISILNTAIAAEHEAVAAYQLGAESGLLSAGVLQVALKFQGHSPVRQRRSGESRRQYPGRRGYALGHLAPGARAGPRAGRLFFLTAMRRHSPGLACGLLCASLCGIALADTDTDISAGEQIYVQCTGCHAPAYHRTGPVHCGVVGRQGGSVADFAFTAAMKNSHLVWNAETLNVFLRAPLTMLPGTMTTRWWHVCAWAISEPWKS